LPSIGGLIFALQQRPSRTPFLIALAASVIWFVIGGFFAFGLISAQMSTAGATGLFGSATALTAAVAILVPIAIFWFSRCSSGARRNSANGLGHDRGRGQARRTRQLAEQSVASSRPDDPPPGCRHERRHLPRHRPGERLEAIVHSEVAALERSYGENELRVRTLTSELATERRRSPIIAPASATR
jgi:hypothetical protein